MSWSTVLKHTFRHRARRCLPYVVASILLLSSNPGCKTARIGSLASLIDSNHTEAIDEMTSNRHSASDVESVALVSSQSTAGPIHHLKPGEDLRKICEQSPGLVLVDFYADWCGPCKKQSKIIHELEEFAANSNTRMIKVNVDEHRELAQAHHVASLPTLVAFKNGAVRETKTGLTSRTQLEKMLR